MKNFKISMKWKIRISYFLTKSKFVISGVGKEFVTPGPSAGIRGACPPPKFFFNYWVSEMAFPAF